MQVFAPSGGFGGVFNFAEKSAILKPLQQETISKSKPVKPKKQITNPKKRKSTEEKKKPQAKKQKPTQRKSQTPGNDKFYTPPATPSPNLPGLQRKNGILG